MTRDEAVSRIQRRLGFRGATFKTDDIIDEMIMAQEELEEELIKSPPWFLLTEMAEAATTANEERIPLPTNFIAEYEHGFLYRYDAALTDPWVELTKGFYGGLKAEHVTAGEPVSYAIVGTYFTLHPTPDAAYILKMRYYKRDTTLTTGSEDEENQWLKWAGRVLMHKAGMNMAEAMKDRATEQYFENHFAVAYKSMLNETQARKIRNMSLVREDV